MINVNSLLKNFTLWGNSQREAILQSNTSLDAEKLTHLDEEIEQGVTVRRDFKRHIQTLSTQTKYELASLALSITTFVAFPFAIIGEIYRLCNGSINASICLKIYVKFHYTSLIQIFKQHFVLQESLTKLYLLHQLALDF